MGRKRETLTVADGFRFAAGRFLFGILVLVIIVATIIGVAAVYHVLYP